MNLLDDGMSALFGSPNKGSGVLNSELYVGRYIWNRSQWVKDPDSGKRKRIVRPETELQVRDCPELRIVDEAAWATARARMGRRRHAAGPRPRTLFGGLLRCGLCGGAVVAVSSHRYGCAARKDRGKVVCPGVLAPRKATDARLLSLLRDELLSPESREELQREVDKIFADAKQHAGIDQETRAARARALDAEISRLVDGIATVGVSEALAARLRAAEAARAALANEPVALPVAAPPDITTQYKQLVLDLQTALASDADRARTVMGEIFDSITLSQEGPETWADVESHADRALIAAAGGASLTVVAGTGFEPVTFGL